MKYFQTIAGSRLYGTNREDSDFDYRGVYLESEEQIFGLKQNKPIESKEPDVVIYPLKTFVHLALNANPNILEILFADQDYWRTNHTIGDHSFFEMFIAERHAFLSQRCRNTYTGYAHSQLKKVLNGEKSPTKNTRSHLIEKFGYDTKYAAHTARLLLQGKDILIHNDFNPTLQGEELEFVLSILNGGMSKEAFADWAYAMESAVRDHITPIKCPEHPNTELVQELLIRCYRTYL